MNTLLTDTEIVELFHKVANLSRQLPASAQDNPVLYIGQYRCLFLLNENGAMHQHRLASQLQIRPASLGELLVKLEKKGYICRTPDAADKRTLVVSLTEEGRIFTEGVYERRRTVHSKMLASLSPEEKNTLYTILTKIQNHYTGGE